MFSSAGLRFSELLFPEFGKRTDAQMAAKGMFRAWSIASYRCSTPPNVVFFPRHRPIAKLSLNKNIKRKTPSHTVYGGQWSGHQLAAVFFPTHHFIVKFQAEMAVCTRGSKIMDGSEVEVSQINNN